MKFLIVFAALCAVALAAPAARDDVEVLRNDSEVGPESFDFDVATSDGSKHSASGKLQYAGTAEEAIAVRGSFSFVADDGQTYTVNYIADENGFQPQGAHLPSA